MFVFAKKGGNGRNSNELASGSLFAVSVSLLRLFPDYQRADALFVYVVSSCLLENRDPSMKPRHYVGGISVLVP